MKSNSDVTMTTINKMKLSDAWITKVTMAWWEVILFCTSNPPSRKDSSIVVLELCRRPTSTGFAIILISP